MQGNPLTRARAVRGDARSTTYWEAPLNRSTTVPALVLAAGAALLLSACGSSAGGGTTTAAAAASSTSPSSAAPTSAPPTSEPPSSSPPASPEPAAGKACSLVDEAAASQILDAPITDTSPAQDVGTSTDDGAASTKLDGCLYTSSKGSLGYDVVKFEGVDSQKLFEMAKLKAAGQLKSGKAVKYDSQGADALAYTLELPLGRTSIVSFASNGWFVTVSAGIKGGGAGPASQAAADAAAQRIADGL